MRALVIMLALAACSDATEAELHELGPCELSWRSTGYDLSDGCEAPCQDRDELGGDATCTWAEPVLGSIPCTSSYIEWGGHRGCCISDQSPRFHGVRFLPCE